MYAAFIIGVCITALTKSTFVSLRLVYFRHIYLLHRFRYVIVTLFLTEVNLIKGIAVIPTIKNTKGEILRGSGLLLFWSGRIAGYQLGWQHNSFKFVHGAFGQNKF